MISYQGEVCVVGTGGDKTDVSMPSGRFGGVPSNCDGTCPYWLENLCRLCWQLRYSTWEASSALWICCCPACLEARAQQQHLAHIKGTLARGRESESIQVSGSQERRLSHLSRTNPG